MASKAFTALIIAFWAVMMTALVRVEFFPASTRLTTVPMEQVTRRLFANDEPQRLSVIYEGKTIGRCDLTVSPRVRLDAPESDPVTKSPGAYFVLAHLKMRLQLLGFPSRFGLDTESWFDPRYNLTKYHLHAVVGTSRIDIRGDNATKVLSLDYDLGDGAQIRQLDYAQLNDPAALESLGLPSVAGLALPVNPGSGKLVPIVNAYEDRIEISGARQHAFLIECKSDQNPGLWAKIWMDDQGSVLLVETSLGITMRSGTMEGFAGPQTKAKTVSEPRKLQ